MLLGITSGKPTSKERDYADVQFFFLQGGDFGGMLGH
jgi:hypothetical protein